jgi:endonuclease-3
MKAEAREAMFERLRARNPNPTTELEYRSAFELLIAVILSAQATDRSVNLATRKLFTVAGTPAEMLALGEPRLAELIRTIGLYKTKAKNVIATCGLLLLSLLHEASPEP